MSGLIGQVAVVAATARAKGLDPALRADAARRILDVVGNSLAAVREPVAAAAHAVAREWGHAGPATVIGSAEPLPAAGAAFVNGVLAHALDFDDTHLPSVLHPSASVVPAALAAAEHYRVPGGLLLDAVTMGLEVCVRLGMAGYDEHLGNSIFFERGQHATSICGAVGAAVAVAMIAGLDEAGIASAAGIAASMGAGLLEANRTGGTVKRVHCGWAAHAAVSAAALARHGVTGPPTVLEGRFGFFQAWCGPAADPAYVVRGLGEEWETPGIFFKPYPCNHFTQAGIDAALELRQRGLDPAAVVAGELRVAAPVLRTIAEPRDLKIAPPTGYAAAFSGPYTVAAALLGGGGLGVGYDDFTDEAARDLERRALAAKIECVADPELGAIYPRQFPAELRLRTGDGREWVARVEANRGGPGRPLSDAEHQVKFELNAGRVLAAEQLAAVRDAVAALADDGAVTDLTALLRVGVDGRKER